MRVSCYGRAYEAEGEGLKTLMELLACGNKALANRYRVGASWPRGRQPQQRLRVDSHDAFVTLRAGGTVRVFGEFNIGQLGPDERRLIFAITDALREYKALESATNDPASDPHADSTGKLSTREKSSNFALAQTAQKDETT